MWQISSTQGHFVYNQFLVLDVLFQTELQILPGWPNQSHSIIIITVRNLLIFFLNILNNLLLNRSFSTVIMPRIFSCSPKLYFAWCSAGCCFLLETEKNKKRSNFYELVFVISKRIMDNVFKYELLAIRRITATGEIAVNCLCGKSGTKRQFAKRASQWFFLWEFDEAPTTSH